MRHQILQVKTSTAVKQQPQAHDWMKVVEFIQYLNLRIWDLFSGSLVKLKRRHLGDIDSTTISAITRRRKSSIIS
jgi:hypothetical protein